MVLYTVMYTFSPFNITDEYLLFRFTRQVKLCEHVRKQHNADHVVEEQKHFDSFDQVLYCYYELD